MKILYLSHKPIYPKVDGGCVAMANFMDLMLENGYNIRNLTIATNKHPFKLSDYPKEIASKVNPEAIKIDTDVKISKALPYLFKSGSYNVDRFYSKSMEDKIVEELSANNFDFVILESLFTTPYLQSIRKHFKGKVILRSHNVEYKIWEDLSTNTSAGLKKRYLKQLARDIKTYEMSILRQLDGILTITEDDAQFYRQNTSTTAETIPFALKTNNTIENDYSGADFFHLGGMDWEPNKEAVERIIQLFPDILKSNSEAKLHIIGKGTESLNVKDKSIVLEGFVKDLEQHCISFGTLVTPIVSGSGVRIKILEMMSLGIPVITTEKGAQGINYKNNNCLMIANTDKEIIDACIEISSNKNLKKEIGMNAKSYISEHHSFSNISKKLNNFLGTK